MSEKKKSLRERNPHVSASKDPLNREQIENLRSGLHRFWEDTQVVTKPNGIYIINIGNLLAMCDTLLNCKDFDNQQLMLG